MSDAKPLGPIEHVVVLMFENRSFDNVLGGLYPHGPNFDGVPPGFSNPVDPGDPNSPRIEAFQAATGPDAQVMPFPDPNEDDEDMAAQIAGGTMQGFVHNYAKAVKAHGGDPKSVRNIMQFYRPDLWGNLPVTSVLAATYAVSDRYFGSGPVQTWPNRLFAHCGQPGSYVRDGKHYAYLNNADYPNYDDEDPFDGQLDYRTVFQLLDEANPDPSRTAWKVYYDGEVPISAFLRYVHDRWNWIEGGNVYAYRSDLPDYADFAYDVANGTLPTYSFIEPRYQKYSGSGDIPPNSNHPGGSTVDEGLPPISVHDGELFLMDVFQTLASNRALFEKTLLIVTYDEHGGLFDHVAPPKAVSPFEVPAKDFGNFNYSLYGPRVPAIFINPLIRRKVLRPPEGKVFDHTSILSTLCAQFGLKGPLTPRDAVAPPFVDLIDPGATPVYPERLPDLRPTAPARSPVPSAPPPYTPPRRRGTNADAVHRSYLARRGRGPRR